MDSLLLSCLILWITGYSKGFIYDTPTYLLDLRGLVIEANGTCSMGEICRFAECEECTVDKFIPDFAIDGDSSTTWSSFPVSQLPEGDRPSLTLYLGREYSIFAVEVDFYIPPVVWTIQYSEDDSTFLPLVAVVNDSALCTNFTDYPICTDTPYEIDIHVLAQANFETIPRPSSLRFTFITPSPLLQDPREMFFEVAEIIITVICEEALSLFDNPTNCSTNNRIYQATITVPDDILLQGTYGRLIWQEFATMSKIVWYLDDVIAGNDFRDDFESGSINETKWNVTGGRVQPAPCDDQSDQTLLFSKEDTLGMIRGATTMFIQISGQLSFDLGFLDPSFQCTNYLEIPHVELVYCDEDQCQLLGFFTLGDCGDCVNKHLLRLRLLSIFIESTINEISLFSILIVNNETDFQLILQKQDLAQIAANDWLLQLTALERLYGTPSEYPDNVVLPPYIVDIENGFSGSILDKLDILCELLENTTEFDELKNTSIEVLEMVNDLKMEVSIVLIQFSQLQNQTNTLLMNLSILLDQLLEHFTSISQALTKGNATLQIIQSRQYTDLIQMIMQLKERTRTANTNASEYVEVFQVHTELARNISDTLSLHETYLNQVINTSNDLIRNATDVTIRITEVEDILNEIKILISMAEGIRQVILNNLNNARIVSNMTKLILIRANEIQQNINTSIEELNILLSMLMERIEDYGTNLDIYKPQNFPQSCMLEMGELTCMRGELHAKRLEQNASRIIAESSSTLQYGRNFLDSLSNLTVFDFDVINETALNAIVTGNRALSFLEQADLENLAVQVRETEINIQTLSDNTSILLTNVTSTYAAAESEYNRSILLDLRFNDLEMDLNSITSDITELENASNYTTEAVMIENQVAMLLGVLQNVNDSLKQIEGDVLPVVEKVEMLSNITQETKNIIENTESQIPRVEEFLSTTERIVEETRAGLDDVLQQNSDIISEIETLIANVGDTHDLVRRINSPALFQQNQPYISMQPPPGRNLDRGIQFESLNMHLIPNSPNTPVLLFYAGPVVEEGSPGNESVLGNEDFIAITSEDTNNNEDMLLLQWRIGNSEGSINEELTLNAISEIFVTRTGSMFELQGAKGGASLQAPTRNVSVIERALLFQMTDNTEFLVGGKPLSAKLAIADYDKYNSFLGQFGLVLFNGAVWSLWDYRRRSETVFVNGFIRVITDNNIPWIPRKNPTSSTNVLSFDGTGYLKPKQFIQSGSFVSGSRIFLYIRTESLEGLVFYMYDELENVDLEVAFYNGFLYIRLGQPNVQNEILVSRQIENIDFDETSITLSRISTFIILGGNFPSTVMQATSFFSDLTQVGVWYGGVKEDQLSESFRPKITTKSYRGCFDIDIDIQTEPSTQEVLEQTDFFVENYLESSIQKGMSATCLRTTFTQEVGFNGTEYLSYTYLVAAEKPTEGQEDNTITDQLTLALSFLPMKDNMVLLAAQDGDRMIVIELDNNLVVATIVDGSETILMSSQEGAVTQNEWHHILLQIGNSQPNPEIVLNLFVDDILVATDSITGFSFSLPFSRPSPNSPPILYVGGAPPSISTRSVFIGCMRDLVYNFDPISFMSASLDSFVTPDGVTFQSCPFLSGQSEADLPLVFSPPEERTCLSSQPVFLNDTIGGFHAHTKAFSYNVLPLQTRVWSLEFAMRRFAPEGHVITISSVDGVNLTLTLQSGDITWQLQGQDGSLDTTSPGNGLPVNTWVNMKLDCGITNSMLSCTPSVDGISLSTITGLHRGNIFVPQLPVAMGQISNMNGFVGCLKDLQIDGESMGFDIEGISTCEKCYAEPSDGWGFTGISYLTKNISLSDSPQFRVSFSFQPIREHGLLFLLSTASSPISPLLGVGLYQGELRLTNFTQPGAFMSQTTESLCVEGFHSLSADFSSNSVNIMLTTSSGSVSSMTIQINELSEEPVRLYLGGLTDDFQDVSVFEFLLSGTFVSGSAVPYFVGCMRQVEVEVEVEVEVTGSAIDILTDSAISILTDISDADGYENVLVGLCPN